MQIAIDNVYLKRKWSRNRKEANVRSGSKANWILKVPIGF